MKSILKLEIIKFLLTVAKTSLCLYNGTIGMLLYINESFLFLVTLLLCCKNVVGNELRIKNENEFIDFVSNVNSGTDDYSGTTIYLDSDLSLSGETLDPIGLNTTYQFLGVFDGQGHIISDLKINISSSRYTGLFGFSYGLTIRNVVLDSSCSITNSFSGSNEVHVGGIIGRCYAGYGQCKIENSVNMANVTSSGNIGSNNLYLGGIVGYLWSSGYPIRVKNCASYGSITQSGNSNNSYIGGIVGNLDGSSYAYIQNSLNYGTITHSGTTSSSLYIGGIAGYSYYAYIENCVSAGEISMQNIPSNSYIGIIVGSVDYSTYIKYSYYTSELSGYDLYGYAYSTPSTSYVLGYDNTSSELNGTVSVGSYTENSLIDALNAYSDYYFLCDYSKWLLNKEEKSVNFTINGRTNPIAMDYQVILLPSLASEGSLMFDGWYNDNKCTNPLESFEITADKTFYGRFEENTNNYTISFDARREGVYVAPITAQFGTVVSLPSESIREHCNVSWKNEYGDNVGLSLTMPAHNFTLYAAIWKCTHISRIDDFIDFSRSVNSGTNFKGTTIYLDSDLSLSDKTLGPIGKNGVNHFNGVFDGQGYIISDLKINSYLQHTGLFCYSKGLTIRNVALDSSCSITKSYSGSDTYIGGIIGYCYSISGQCNIENNVNMADVTFSGKINNRDLYLGGIAGYLSSSSSYSVCVKNCVNYGSVTHSGTSGDSFIGGIVGYLYGLYYKYIQNSLNYGTITHSGTTKQYSYLGGIAGHSSSAFIVNCVSAGEISTQNTPSTTSYIGSIVGFILKYTSINYCYYTSDVNESSLYGYAAYTPITTGTTNSPTDVDPDLVNKLNNNATSCNWDKWLLNANNATVTFIIGDDKELSFSSQIILIQNPVKEGNSFLFWCKDVECNEEFDPETESVSGITALYAAWVNNTVTFDFGNGTTVNETFTYNAEIIYPEKEGYSLSWTNYHKFMPAKDITVTAQWTPNNYTVAFDFDNGTTVDDTFTYNTEITYPDIKKEGYTLSWDNYHELMPAGDITVTAQWIPNNYTVTFDFGNGTSETKVVTFDKKYETFPVTEERIGHTFSGWFTDKNVGVTDETIVNIANNHILHALYTPNNYSVKFVCGNKTIYEYLMTYNTSIEYKGENPTKAFHKFDSWCIENGMECLPKRVPAGNITFYAHFTIDAAAVSGTAVGSFVGVVLLVFLIIVLVVIILILKKGMKIGHEAVDVEMSQTNATERNKENNSRIIKHMVAMSISNGTVNKLEKCSKNKKKDRVLNEVFDDLGVDYNDNPYGISESFKMMGVVDTIVNNLQSNTNHAAVGSYLSLLFAAVREQEDFEAFEKLYFGMKDANKFIHTKKDDGTIRFEGIMTGFTDKLMVIQLLSEGEEDDLPRGVLFKVQNGKGYNVESQSEILFELNSVFSIERMEEVIRDRYIVVKLSYTSPNSEDEMVSI